MSLAGLSGKDLLQGPCRGTTSYSPWAPLEVLFLMLPLPVPPGRGVRDRGIGWVLLQTHGHPVQFFQPSLASQLILPLGSAVSENALEQTRGRTCCSPGCSGLLLCCRQWERSWQG